MISDPLDHDTPWTMISDPLDYRLYSMSCTSSALSIFSNNHSIKTKRKID